jgi:hypothetical protein
MNSSAHPAASPSIIGLDLAKRVFQVHGATADVPNYKMKSNAYRLSTLATRISKS